MRRDRLFSYFGRAAISLIVAFSFLYVAMPMIATGQDKPAAVSKEQSTGAGSQTATKKTEEKAATTEPAVQHPNGQTPDGSNTGTIPTWATSIALVCAGIVVSILAMIPVLNSAKELVAAARRLKQEWIVKAPDAEGDGNARDAAKAPAPKIPRPKELAKELDTITSEIKTERAEREAARAEREARRIKDEQRRKALLEDLTDKTRDPRDISKLEWGVHFAQQVRLSAVQDDQLNQETKMIVVASGKGGVGKSTLSLALAEAFMYDNKHVLLVDFDLPNRGLTSLLKTWSRADGEYDSIFSLLKEFDQCLLKRGSADLGASGAAKDQLEVAWQRAKARAKAIESLGGRLDNVANEMLGMATSLRRKLRTLRLPSSRSVVPVDERGQIAVSNSHFLPSLNRNELFLGSDIFEVDFVEVYYFLKLLQYWANLHGYHRVILDCHGAHDHLMIGAMHAATALLIVTTAEPGGFDGTHDLVGFAKKLEAAHQRRIPSVLAVNNCREWQQEGATAIEGYVNKMKLEGTLDAGSEYQLFLKIANSPDASSVASTYTFGMIPTDQALWESARGIQKFFEDSWDSLSKARPTQSNGVNGDGVRRDVANAQVGQGNATQSELKPGQAVGATRRTEQEGDPGHRGTIRG